jgi:hypothetical protein
MKERQLVPLTTAKTLSHNFVLLGYVETISICFTKRSKPVISKPPVIETAQVIIFHTSARIEKMCRYKQSSFLV